MGKRILVTVIALAIIAQFLGCATIPMQSKLKKPVSMTKMQEDVVKSFIIQQHGYWAFWGVIPVKRPNVDKALKKMIDDYEGVQNLKITAKHSFVDYLITVMTVSFIHSKTFILEGEVFDLLGHLHGCH